MAPTSPARRPHDSEASRAAILTAAESVFAEHGYSGARVDQIAARSGYNKSLIFQYFGDKLGLYAAIIARADAEAAALQARALGPLLSGEPPREAAALRALLGAALDALIDHLQARPLLLRILLWELAEGWRTYQQLGARPQPDEAAPLEARFAELHAAGLLRSPISPAIQLTLALQTCQVFLACQPLYQALTLGQELSPTAARRYLVDTIVAGLVPDPPAPPLA